MKKVLALVAATGMLAAASFASAATIVGSKHDLSSTGGGTIKGTATDSSQICVYCHAPHGAAKSYPLWNRSNPAATGFILYSGLNMASVSFKTGFTSDSTSLFCMSCHDGATQMGALHNVGALQRGAGLGQAGTAGLPFITDVIGGAAKISGVANGKDLSKTHPVNFPVASTDSQNDLWVPGGAAATTMGSGLGTPAATFPLYKTANDAGMAGRATSRSLECGSCHAVHDSANSPFLRYTMAGSQLCLGCHNK